MPAQGVLFEQNNPMWNDDDGLSKRIHEIQLCHKCEVEKFAFAQTRQFILETQCREFGMDVFAAGSHTQTECWKAQHL